MPRRTLDNIFHLGVKELRSLWHDRMMLILILWAFTLGVVSAANALPETLQRAAIAIVDEDRSTLSHRIADAFYPPYFVPPAIVDHDAADKGLEIHKAGNPKESLKVLHAAMKDLGISH